MNAEGLTKAQVYGALKVLFSFGTEIDGSLLRTVQTADIKSAYRKKAMATHPDHHADRDERFRKACSRRFIAVSEAYATLTRYVKLREEKGLNLWQEEAKRPVRPARHQSSPHRTARKAGPSGPAPSKSESGFFWHRVLPDKPLRIAEFLFYTGVIPWHLFIKAIVWQRAQRPRLGEIAQKWRWLTESQIRILMRCRQPGELLGEALVRHGLLKPFQLRVLVAQQRKMQQPIGNFFVRNGHLSPAQMEHYLRRQQSHNRKYSSDFAPLFNSW